MAYTTTDRRAQRSDHHRVGSPAHFAAFVREADRLRGSGVLVDRVVEGFIVPADGLWMIDGQWVAAGTEMTLGPGSTVKYHDLDVDVSLHGDDPKYQEAAQRGHHAPRGQVQGSAVYDPKEQTMMPVTAGTLDALPAMAAAKGAREGRLKPLPNAARARGRTKGGLYVP